MDTNSNLVFDRREIIEIFSMLAARGKRLRLAQKQSASPDDLGRETGEAGSGSSQREDAI